MQIQAALYAGKLKVGDRLPNERHLGEIFGVSRATLREALRLLEALGIVEVRRGATGGAFIATPVAEHAGMLLSSFIHFRHATSQDLNEFRETFEAETAFSAAERITEDETGPLWDLVTEFKNLNDNSSWGAFVDIDLKFHMRVAELSKNQIRIAIMQGIHNVFRNSSLAIEKADSPTWRTQQKAEIAAVADAIAQHRPMEARQLMQAHVKSNIQLGESSY